MSSPVRGYVRRAPGRLHVVRKGTPPNESALAGEFRKKYGADPSIGDPRWQSMLFGRHFTLRYESEAVHGKSSRGAAKRGSDFAHVNAFLREQNCRLEPDGSLLKLDGSELSPHEHAKAVIALKQWVHHYTHE